MCLHLLESLSFVITVEHLKAEMQGPGTVWGPFPKLGTSSTALGCRLPNPSAAKSADELLVLVSVRDISCGGRLYLICAMIAAPSYK